MQTLDEWVHSTLDNDGVDTLINELIKMYNCAPKNASGTPAEIVRTTYGILNGDKEALVSGYVIDTEAVDKMSPKDMLKQIMVTVKEYGSAIPISINEVVAQAKQLAVVETKMLYYVAGVILLSSKERDFKKNKYLISIKNRLEKKGRNPVVAEVSVDELCQKYSKDPVELGMEYFQERVRKSRVKTAVAAFLEEFEYLYNTDVCRHIYTESVWDFSTLRNKVINDFTYGELGDDFPTDKSRQYELRSTLCIYGKDEGRALIELAGVITNHRVDYTNEWYKDVARIAIYLICECYIDVSINKDYDHARDYVISYTQGKQFLGIGDVTYDKI